MATKLAKSDPALTPRRAALKKRLDAMPGAVATPMRASTGKVPIVLIYKVMTKTFAILTLRGDEYVMLKTDLAEMLRERYAGVGHRTHLDPRHWIAVTLHSDVPAAQIAKLAAQSYELVCAGLTRKQKAELEALAS